MGCVLYINVLLVFKDAQLGPIEFEVRVEVVFLVGSFRIGVRLILPFYDMYIRVEVELEQQPQ